MRHGGGIRVLSRSDGDAKAGTGTPRPRLFRLERDQGVIDRLGFNNDGAEARCRRPARARAFGGIVGVNVGANKDTGDRAAYDVKLIELCAGR